MSDRKIVRTHRSYEADFKHEVAGMLTTGESVREISETFGIVEKRYAVAAWLLLEKMGNDEDQGSSNDKTAKLAAKIAKLRAENERLMPCGRSAARFPISPISR